MHARLTTLQGDPERIEGAVQVARDEVLPTLREQDGWKGFTVLVDRSSGRMLGISFWESEDALAASDAAIAASRERAAEVSGAQSPSVERLEVVLDEMA